MTPKLAPTFAGRPAQRNRFPTLAATRARRHRNSNRHSHRHSRVGQRKEIAGQGAAAPTFAHSHRNSHRHSPVDQRKEIAGQGATAPTFALTFAGRPAQIRRFCWLLGDGGQFMGTIIAPPAVLAPAASAAVAPVVSAAAPLAAMASATSTAVVSAGASPAVLASATSTVVVSAAVPPAALPPVVLPWRPTPAALCDSKNSRRPGSEARPHSMCLLICQASHNQGQRMLNMSLNVSSQLRSRTARHTLQKRRGKERVGKSDLESSDALKRTRRCGVGGGYRGSVPSNGESDSSIQKMIETFIRRH